MTEQQIQFHSKKDLEERIYVNFTEEIVLIYKSKEDRDNPNKKPYKIMSINEFKEFFKVWRQRQ